MERPTQSVQFADDVKSEIKQNENGSYANSSDELDGSDHTDDDTVFISGSPYIVHPKRSLTFTINPNKEESISGHMLKSKTSNRLEARVLYRQPELCQECSRQRNTFHRPDRQYLLHVYTENQRLTEQLCSITMLNKEYEFENMHLRKQLAKVTSSLDEYKELYNRLKQKPMTEKYYQPKPGVYADHIRRLRYELDVYKHVITSKQQAEQKQIDYFNRYD